MVHSDSFDIENERPLKVRIYAADDPVNESDPTGLCVSTPFGCVGPGPANGIGGTLAATWNDTGGKVVSAVHQHWRGIVQGTEIAGAALAAAGCIAATAGVCGTVIGTVLTVGGIGGVTGFGFYSASSGPHTLSGYAQAFGLGSLGGILSAGCALSAGTFCATVTGGFIFNSLVGAGIGAYGYLNDQCSPSALGLAEALLWGAFQNEPFPVPEAWLPS